MKGAKRRRRRLTRDERRPLRHMTREISQRVYELQHRKPRRDEPPPVLFELLDQAVRGRHDSTVARCIASYHRGDFTVSAIDAPLASVVAREASADGGDPAAVVAGLP